MTLNQFISSPLIQVMQIFLHDKRMCKDQESQSYADKLFLKTQLLFGNIGYICT